MTDQEALSLVDMVINHISKKPMFEEHLPAINLLRQELYLNVLAQRQDAIMKEMIHLDVPKFFYE